MKIGNVAIRKPRVPSNGKKTAGALDQTISKDIAKTQNLFDQIQKKAYELYQKRGCQGGNEFKDWLEAEKIVRAQLQGK